MGLPNQESSKEMMKNKNVAGGQLALLSKDPPTGYYRDGYCRTGPEDRGNHSVGATVNQEFLDFTHSKGNPLRDAGVTDGMKWCLCSKRWKEAFDAAESGDLPKSAVPRVYLHACHESALKDVKYSDLKQYAAQPEASKELANRKQSHQSPEKPRGVAQESSETSSNSEATGGPGVRAPKGK